MNIDIYNQQGKSITKSNDIIQKTRYSLSLQEQKVILFLISKIKFEDIDFNEYEFDIKELCNIMNVSLNGKNYINFKNSIKKLADKSFWLDTEKGSILCRWIAKAKIIDSKIIIKLDDDLKPYLLQLCEFFTTYSLEYVLLMQSKYSIRLYEYLKSYSNLKILTVDLQELKSTLGIDGYNVYKDFRVNVLEPAIHEINSLTDLQVDFTPKRSGRYIKSLEFEINEKSSAKKVETFLIRRKSLEKKSL